MSKIRLDALIAREYPTYSKTQIQAWIKAGHVQVDDQILTKPGALVAESSSVRIAIPEQKYVSRAGYKLEHALHHFGIEVNNLTALDAGLSTGGFTDCLLQHDIAKVYGIDVGHGQVHETIRQDSRVVVMEGVNLRYLENLQPCPVPQCFGINSGCLAHPERSRRVERVDLITLDLSFISVLKVMDAITKLLKPHGKLLVLIKPQFEAGPEHVGKGGIIKDSHVHAVVLERTVAGITAYGFVHQGTIDSPILGSDGNKEFLSYFIAL